MSQIEVPQSTQSADEIIAHFKSVGGSRWVMTLIAEIERLRLFLGEIAAMGPADEEWDADTLESAVALAARALQPSGASQ